MEEEKEIGELKEVEAEGMIDLGIDTREEKGLVFTDVEGNSSLDTATLHKLAKNIISKQANLARGEHDGDINLYQIELVKGQANSFIEALDNVLKAEDRLDLLAGQELKFKRVSEMGILNNLKDQCEMQAELGKKTIENINRRLLELLNNSPMGGNGDIIEVDESIAVQDNIDDMREVEMLQAMLDNSIDNTAKLIKSMDSLIKLERTTGGRQYGNKAPTQPGNISYVSGMADAAEKGSTSKSKRVPVPVTDKRFNQLVENTASVGKLEDKRFPEDEEGGIQTGGGVVVEQEEEIVEGQGMELKM